MVDDIGFYTLPAFSALPCIGHGFSARTGGRSVGCYESLNLSFSRSDDPALVRENYRLFAAGGGFPNESMVMDCYAHGTIVRKVDAADRGCGWTRPSLPSCDGLITNDRSVTLVTGHADCMAFYCCDPVKNAIGLAHAGWRGTLNRIGKKMIESMTAAYDSCPADLILGVGPSICPDCFEVGTDVALQFTEAFPAIPCVQDGNLGKAHVNLWMVAACQFLEAGVLPEHINLSGVCTVEDERLYSHRRDHGETGGMAAFLRLL